MATSAKKNTADEKRICQKAERAVYRANKAKQGLAAQQRTPDRNQAAGTKHDPAVLDADDANKPSSSYATGKGDTLDMQSIKSSLGRGVYKKQKTSTTTYASLRRESIDLSGLRAASDRHEKKLKMRYKRATVETEAASLAKEVGGHLNMMELDDVPNRGTIDQKCVLEDVLGIVAELSG